MNSDQYKIFFVGFNKTGTVTLHNILAQHYKSLHDDKWRWTDLSRNASDQELLEYLEPFDCFSDGELADFKRLSVLYPNARFVLNTRPLFAWLFSRIKHVHRFYPSQAQGTFVKRYPGIYSADKLVRQEVIRKWVVLRNEYYRSFGGYFQDSGFTSLVIDVTSQGFLPRLSKYLGKEFKYNGEGLNVRTLSSMPVDAMQFIQTEKATLTEALLQAGISEKDFDSPGIVQCAS